MTKTIFACKQVKEFSLKKRPAFLTAVCTIIMYFFKNFFMGKCPCNTGNGNGEYKKRSNLVIDC